MEMKLNPGKTEANNSDPQPAWHILYTNPRAEKKVAELLRKFRFEAYLPLIQEKVRWTDRWKVTDRPMFMSYVFVKIKYAEDKTKVLQLPGVHHIVFSKENIPAILADSEILNMKTLVENFSETIEVKRMEAIQPGKLVKIIAGPFQGQELEVVRIGKKNKIVLRFPMVEQVATAEVPLDYLDWKEIDSL
jgi:transcription antitermination factor NusG